MWKTTDRYVQQKRVKAADAESKLKQVYIPGNPKSNSVVINNIKAHVNGSSNGNETLGGLNKPCESCSTNASSQVIILLRNFFLFLLYNLSTWFLEFNVYSIWFFQLLKETQSKLQKMVALSSYHTYILATHFFKYYVPFVFSGITGDHYI